MVIFSQLLPVIGMPLVGGVAARLVAERYQNLPELLARDPAEVQADLSIIRGIGPKIAESVARFMGDENNRKVLQKLIELDVQLAAPAPRAVVGTGPLSGSSFCVTGTLIFDCLSNSPSGAIWLSKRRAPAASKLPISVQATVATAGAAAGAGTGAGSRAAAATASACTAGTNAMRWTATWFFMRAGSRSAALKLPR